ncbi:hypothetical protein [Paenibacillus sp. UNC499MF]|uniref:hypothetical protein n=1 Tax=Paenibacillus sp. UNC499MF TaxID=1502751 RepID=UPI0008A005B9|nr:hypothetical protein [Paenibacillus sp. UNC499MF]SEG79588.1 hypothetical protein SAMN02799616_05214 [Paenibacillus sp. UNC499MF]
MDFSIEYNAERIYHPKTKEYFNEVISSYNNGSYRSAVVMLYSVVICDLVYKITDLKDLYNDTIATSIIIEIETMQQQNPRSPDWETRLVEMIHERTSLIDNVDKQYIDNLKSHRHLSAHPVINENYILFKPNKETVRAHIRNILESVLTKAPLLSKSITIEFLLELARVSQVMLDDQHLKRYLEAKFLQHFVRDVENKVFRDIWKFVFKLENADCETNREINYRALKIIFERNHRYLLDLINQEKNYYSDISLGTPTTYLLKFLAEFPMVYTTLNDACKAIIETTVNSDLDLLITSWFMSDNLESHIQELANKLREDEDCYVDESEIKKLLEIASTDGLQSKVYDLMIIIFGKSPNFDQSDYRYLHYIKPYLENYTEDNFHNLLQAINSNSQIYWRRSIREQNREVKQYSDRVLGVAFDYDQFFHFTTNL